MVSLITVTALIFALVGHVVLARTQSLVILRLSRSPPAGASAASVASTASAPPPMFVVISSCLRGPQLTLAHVQKYLNANSTQVRLINKCGGKASTSPVGPGVANKSIQMIHLPNVGRNDHSYAWALSSLHGALVQPLPDNALVFFLKDNIGVHSGAQRTRSFPEVIAEARSRGFACFATMLPPATDLHLIQHLGRFEIASYMGAPSHLFRAPAGQRPLFKWWEQMGLTFGNLSDANAAIPVCYHGNFAVRMDKIRAVNSAVWPRIVTSLSHGDSIEEGHYLERTWGALFSQPSRPTGLTLCGNSFFLAGRMCTAR